MKLLSLLWTVLFGVVLWAAPASAQTQPAPAGAQDSAAAAPKPPAKQKASAAAGASTSQPGASTQSAAAAQGAAAPRAGTASAAQTGASAKPATATPSVSAGANAGAASKPPPAGAAPTPSSPPAQTSTAGAQGAAPAGVDPATYVVRLRDLESRVEELKEQIRRSHTRLSLLSESVLAAGVGGAQARVLFRNAMSNAFRVTGVLVVLDGAVQYNERGDDAPHLRQRVTPIFDGAVPPGDHTLQIVVTLQGHGYGVFSYLKGYTFEARSTHSFTIHQGKGLQLEAIAWEKGTVTTPLDERPAVKFVETPLHDAEGATSEAQ